MRTPKALLDWHGEPLVHRVAGIVARVCRPVVVVGAPGAELPVPAGAETAADATPGLGPLEGIAAGLRALDGRADVVFVAATDLPLLHPEFVAAVLAALPGFDAVVPVAGGRDQPLAAAYTAAWLAQAGSLLAAGRPRAAGLLERARVRRLDAAGLPEPDSLLGANTPGAYRRLLALPQPPVTVAGADGRIHEVAASTLAAALSHVAATRSAAGMSVTLNGRPVVASPMLPLVRGDRLAVRA
jgi:molybdenum cofactor guanylyltransferase